MTKYTPYSQHDPFSMKSTYTYFSSSLILICILIFIRFHAVI